MFDSFIKKKCFSRAAGRQAVVCVSLIGILCLWALLLCGCQEYGSAVILTGTAETDGTEISADAIPGAQDGEGNVAAELSVTEETTALAQMWIHVCGHVCTSGVYVLPEGSRVWDAVQAAGGASPEAHLESVNLAMPLEDGSKVTIPSQAESQEDGFRWYEDRTGTCLTIGGDVIGGSLADSRDDDDDGRISGLVDINRADVNALMTIPGIGQSRAESIVAYRENRGPFGAIEEIMQVTGIKEGLFAKIRDYITVGG